MKSVHQTEKDLGRIITSLLNKEIAIKYSGDHAVGDTWQETLGLPRDNRSRADWDNIIEIKCLTYKNNNIKNGSDLTLSSKTLDWERLREFNITKTSVYRNIDYGYKQSGGGLFFTKKLRYIVALSSRSIEWYVVKLEQSTEPYSKVPARSGQHVFSWKIEDVFGKIEKLSLTIVLKKGDYPNGVIIPVRSYMVDMNTDKVLTLLAEGSIRYEVRYGPAKGYSTLFHKVKDEGLDKFSPTSLEFWNWVDTEFINRGGKLKDYGTGFRLKRNVLNSLLDLRGELLKQ